MPEEPRRTVTALDALERASIWRYNDPIWEAHYCWHPEEGWLYWTPTRERWQVSINGHGIVDTRTISHSPSATPRDFTELARFNGTAIFAFAPDGTPIELPRSLTTPALVPYA